MNKEKSDRRWDKIVSVKEVKKGWKNEDNGCKILD